MGERWAPVSIDSSHVTYCAIALRSTASYDVSAVAHGAGGGGVASAIASSIETYATPPPISSVKYDGTGGHSGRHTFWPVAYEHTPSKPRR